MSNVLHTIYLVYFVFFLMGTDLEIKKADISHSDAIKRIWNPIIRDTLWTFNSQEKSIKNIEDLIYFYRSTVFYNKKSEKNLIKLFKKAKIKSNYFKIIKSAKLYKFSIKI